MNIKVTAQTAMTAVLRNKTRSILTTLGVVIGVASVILLTAIGNGLTVFVEEQFQNLGSNLLIVAPGDIVNEDGGFNQETAALSLSSSKLSLNDVGTLERIGKPIEAVTPVIEGSGEFRSPQGKKQGFVIASGAEYTYMRSTKAEIGRFFSDSDVSSNRKVAVIGNKIAVELYEGLNPVGETITINRIKFEVIGVIEKKSDGGFGGPDLDSAVYVPVTAARTALGLDKISYLLAQVDDKNNIDYAKQKVETAMLKRLNEEDFSVTDQSEILKTIQTILGTLTVGLAGIAAISLLVGGIGIMNIMLD